MLVAQATTKIFLIADWWFWLDQAFRFLNKKRKNLEFIYYSVLLEENRFVNVC